MFGRTHAIDLRTTAASLAPLSGVERSACIGGERTARNMESVTQVDRAMTKSCLIGVY